jgi:hypothetical protein
VRTDDLDQKEKTFASAGASPRGWIGRIIVAVILGEAIWNLIVSVINNLAVPWVGDLLGQSSGLPTSFTQRPYNYPDVFVSLFEVGVAGLVTAILNYFLQPPRAARSKPAKTTAAPVGPARVISPEAMAAAQAQLVKTDLPVIKPGPPLPPTPVVKPDPVAPAAPVTPPPMAQAPSEAPAAPARPLAVAPSPPVASSVAKPVPPAPAAEAPKPKKPKEVYYNMVGEPMPSDED